MAHLLHMAHLILSRRGDSSYGCNTVPMLQTVFVCPWSGEVCMMAEAEDDALLTIIIVCEKKRKNESFGADQLFSRDIIKFFWDEHVL